MDPTSGSWGNTKCSDILHSRSQLVRAIVVVVSKDCILTEPGHVPATLKLALHTQMERQADSAEVIPVTHLGCSCQVEETLTIDMTSTVDLKACSHDDLHRMADRNTHSTHSSFFYPFPHPPLGTETAPQALTAVAEEKAFQLHKESIKPHCAKVLLAPVAHHYSPDLLKHTQNNLLPSLFASR